MRWIKKRDDTFLMVSTTSITSQSENVVLDFSLFITIRVLNGYCIAVYGSILILFPTIFSQVMSISEPLDSSYFRR